MQTCSVKRAKHNQNNPQKPDAEQQSSWSSSDMVNTALATEKREQGDLIAVRPISEWCFFFVETFIFDSLTEHDKSNGRCTQIHFSQSLLFDVLAFRHMQCAQFFCTFYGSVSDCQKSLHQVIRADLLYLSATENHIHELGIL